MKKINSIKLLLATTAVLTFASCDRGFVDVNQTPYNQNTIDPGILLSSAERFLSTGSWEVESTIVQQFVNAVNAGATKGFQFNEINGNETYNRIRWNQMYDQPNGAVRLLDRALELAKTDPRKNLIPMLRILRAMNYMILVDTYGDVPYSEANKGFPSALITNPKYDKDSDIYTDLYKELKEARAALDPANVPTNAVNTDILYGTSATATNPTVQIPKWQRLAGSLMLRLGMRYTKIDVAKATAIVADALSSTGVMTSTSDNALIPFNATDNNPLNAGPRGTNPFNYYLYDTFVNNLKDNKDPRGKYIVATYQAPNVINGIPQDTVLANQFGFPLGYSDGNISSAPGYKGLAQVGAGWRYSQLNYNSFGSNTAPIFLVTYAQTQLLLADAAVRGIVAGGMVQAVTYYNAGIRASMDEYPLYPNTAAIPANTYNSYINMPNVLVTVATPTATALDRINTQYWIASLGIQSEVWANYRRTGYPVLPVNPFGGIVIPGGGFARRIPYPFIERSVNPAGYNAAVARIGGTDNIVPRVFWDQ